MTHIIAFINLVQTHPLLWQAPIAALSTSGFFAWLKYKLELEGSKQITLYLTIVTGVAVMLHITLIGATFVSAADLIKTFGEGVLVMLGLLTLVYNFIVKSVIKFLQDAKARAVAREKLKLEASAQKNLTEQSGSAVAAGVAQF
jgi:hypothetical protein